MAHIKSTQAANPTLMFKDVLKLAGKTYKKGASVVSSAVGLKKSKKVAKKSGKKSRKSGKSKKAKKSGKSKKSKK